MCLPRFGVPVCMCRSACPAGPRARVRACAPVRDPPPPSPPSLPVSSADDIGAEESDDKCPLSANEADDKWAGARAAPLRCNNRRWMAWRPHPHPPPPAALAGNGSRFGSARPGGSRAARWAANHYGPRSPGPGRPSRELTRLPAAKEQSGSLGGSKRCTECPACPRPGHAAVHTHGLYTRQPPASLHGTPAAPVQAQPPRRGSTDTSLPAVHGQTSATQSRVHPPTQIHVHTAMQTRAPAIHARDDRNHLCLCTCRQLTCLHTDRYENMHTQKQKRSSVDINPYTVHTIQELQTYPRAKDAHSCINKC